jgi:hypothetical protein
MRTLIAITRCLKARSDRGEFSFKGFYAGEEITKLDLKPDAGIAEWKRGEDYILYIRVHTIHAGTMRGNVLRSRLLDELVCRD